MEREITFGIDIRFEDGQVLDLTEFLNKTLQENEHLKRELQRASSENHQARILLERVVSMNRPIDAMLRSGPHPVEADGLVREINEFLIIEQ